MCLKCGPRPDTLVFDGIAQGFQSKKLVKWLESMTFHLPVESPTTLEGSKFESRMIIKQHQNRMILKNAAEQKEWPNVTKKVSFTDDDPDYGKRKLKSIKQDIGMEKFMKMVKKLDKSAPPKTGFINLMHSLSTKTSTTSLFQVIDIELMEDLISYLSGEDSKIYI